MKSRRILCAILAVALSFSCMREAESTDSINDSIEMTFTATWATGEDSRTILADNGTDILWSAGESINVFYGSNYSGEFTSLNTTPQASVDFSGALTFTMGAQELENEPHYWAIYPYNKNNYCDGQSVTLTVSQYQFGPSGTFSDKFFPAVAMGVTPDLAFYNVCGGARFSLVTEGVNRVVFRSNDGSPMAGTVRLGFSEDKKPQILEITDAKDSVVLIAPTGGFSPGENYFAAMLPQTHAEGLTVTLYTRNKKATRTTHNSLTVRRSTFGTLARVDEGIAYEDYTPSSEEDPDGIIAFADDRIKSHCVAAFDLNGDGELSYAEAAAVTDVSTAFTSNLYTSFDEFRFFTSVEEIPAGWFKDRARLKSIAFPASLQFIGENAFQNCGTLTKVGIPDMESWLGVDMPSPSCSPFYSSGEGHLYIEDAEQKSVRFPTDCSEITYPLYNCSSIEEISLPAGIISVKSDAFKGCKNLQKANIASLAAWMGITFENQGAAPFNASGEGHLFINGKEVSEPLVPEEVKAFNDYAFYNCTGFTKMMLEPTVPPALGNNALTGTRCYFLVWDECVDAYRTAWSDWSSRIVSENAFTNPEMVDLGLSVKWASCNLGASAPEEYGGYYAWGETVPKSYYNWSNYLWCNGSESSINKYYDGDGKYLLDLEDDAVAVALEDNWRIPTSTEWRELVENSTCEWTKVNGVYGRKMISKKEGYTNRWIFLPAAGYTGNLGSSVGLYGFYWSSTLDIQSIAHSGYFHSKDVCDESTYRCFGQSLRPVYGNLVRVFGISLEDTKVRLGESVQLRATILPANASEQRVVWKSSDETVATISVDGVVTPICVGMSEISATTIDGNYTANCIVEVLDYELSVPEMVDLGLSVKWASYNIGSHKPEDYGVYFAWGETEPKSDYSWSTYKWCNGSSSTLTKYCNSDRKTVLALEDDAAHVLLGGSWRMPTNEEREELKRNCTWTLMTLNGVYGSKVISNKYGYTDKWIFLPAAGLYVGMSLNEAGSFGDYWTSSLYTDYPYACNVYFYSGGVIFGSNNRCYGMSIRAVNDGRVYVTGVSLEGDLTLSMGESVQLSATIYPEDATEKGVIWSSSNTSVAKISTDGEVTALSVGETTITVKTVDGGFTASCILVVGFPMVDLGLSVKWAQFNVGATTPEGYGDYFAWGETAPKSNYSWSTYAWCMNGRSYQLTKYCNNIYYGYNGFTDDKMVLDSEDDAAAVKWGVGWRMPTYDEMNELIATKQNTNYKWTWKTINGHNGWEVFCLINGNSIFLPAAGGRGEKSLSGAESVGYYWSSSLHNADSPTYAYYWYFHPDEVGWYVSTRFYGHSVRPVCE